MLLLVYITPEQFAPSSLYEAFFTPDNIESTLFILFLSYCMAVLNCFFFSFFVLCSMLKAEKQAIICTLYTQHTPLQPVPRPPTHTPVCIVPEHQNVKVQTPCPKNKTKKERKKKRTALLQEGSCDQAGRTKTLRNKINRKENVLLIGMYNLCN